MDLKDSEERSDREREKGRGRQRGARWSESVKERPKRCCYEEAQPLLVRRVFFFFFFRFIGAPAEKLIAPEC